MAKFVSHYEGAEAMVRPPFDTLLSQPQLAPSDITAVTKALESGWLAPVGPDLARFEAEVAKKVGRAFAVGLSSGTAGLHLGLQGLGVEPNSFVLVSTVTFAATAFAVVHAGAIPVFVDIDSSWNMDPECSARAVAQLRAEGKTVGAAIPVDLYGAAADYRQLLPHFSELGVPVLEDAAEGLGAGHELGPVGSFGQAGVLSFNGNKIITTSGGGMLVTDSEELAAKVRFWSTQSRDAAPWYEHSEIGYNFRLSNILAALGSSQLSRLDSIVAHRRAVRQWYTDALGGIEGVVIKGDPPWGTSNAWLTVATFDLDLHPKAPGRVREYLEANRIESRPTWKPMHQQPVFKNNCAFLNGNADSLFDSGLCLPSGPTMTQSDVERVSSLLVESLGI